MKEPEKAVKPPIGIMPERNWREERLISLRRAIHRYDCAGLPYPFLWWMELDDLMRKFHGGGTVPQLREVPALLEHPGQPTEEGENKGD